MARRPLYLNGVRAFEATARLGSIAAAAAELNIAPSAVSRMVGLLEDRLGVALFERRANRLAITGAGETYRDGLTPLLDAMAGLTERVAGAGAGAVLTVGVGPTFAVRWLIPRLARFQALAPEAEVRVTAGGAAAPFSDDWTCGIQLGDAAPAGFASDELFAGDLTPVAAPADAARLKAPKDLASETLLRVAHAPEDWPHWLAAAGVEGAAPSGPVFDYYGQAIQAAADGLGVAIGIRPYIDDDLAAGRLVRPFDLAVPQGQHWRLVYRPSRLETPLFASFRDWVLAEVAG